MRIRRSVSDMHDDFERNGCLLMKTIKTHYPSNFSQYATKGCLQSCPSAVIATCESLIKNVMSIGFDERSQWMYSGGEDCTAKVWDYRCSLQCQRIFQVTSAFKNMPLHLHFIHQSDRQSGRIFSHMGCIGYLEAITCLLRLTAAQLIYRRQSAVKHTLC